MFTASVHFKVELIAFAFVESREARTLDRADMHECVWLTIVAYEEAKTLHRIEEFDGPGSFFTGQFTLRGSAAIAAAISIAAAGTLFNRNDIADNLDVLRRHFAAAIDQIEFKTLTFGQTFKAGALNSTDVNENVFAAALLLDEAEALLAVEEFYDALAGADNLSGHAVETAATTAAAAALAAAESSAATTGTTTAAAAAEAITATAAAEPVIAATKTVAAAIAVTAEIAAATERIEALFTETIALITAPTTAPFIITHNLKRTFVSPPDIQFAGNASGSAPNSSGEKTRSLQPPINLYT